MRGRERAGVIAAVVVMAVSGAACSSSPKRTGAPTTTKGRPLPTTPRATCATPSVFGARGAARNEVHGTAKNGELWGLALGPAKLPLRAGDEMKFVWRMTGTGPLHVVFRAPDGRPRPLVFGPEPHTGSTYRRPGDEWGTGLLFATRGCWHVHLRRADTSADVWLDVGAPAPSAS